MIHRHIIFLCGVGAVEPLGLYDESVQKAAQYLAQWDDGEEKEICDMSSLAVTEEQVTVNGKSYLLLTDHGIMFIGLTAGEE